MKTNRTKVLTTFLAAVFLLANSQNLAAQNMKLVSPSGATAPNAVASSGDEEGTVDDPKEPEYNLTIDKVDPTRFNTIAFIQGLNKITAKTLILDIKVGDTIKFGKLTITIHKCWQASLDQKPESKILMEIYDSGNGTDEKRSRIFYGWMLSSSPSISALEHPIYDITAVGCKNK